MSTASAAHGSIHSASVITGDWEAVNDRRFPLSEGARCIGTEAAAGAGFGDQHFICVDIPSGRLFSTTGEPGAGLVLRADLDVPLGAAARTAGGGWIAAAGTSVIRLVPAADGSGLLIAGELIAQLPVDSAEQRVNDAVADPHGRFWPGAMGQQGEEGQGLLARVQTRESGPAEISPAEINSAEISTVHAPMTIPNGPAFSADGSTMYFAETSEGRIMRATVDPETGGVGSPELFAQIDEGNPDGMTVDAEGCLWQAVYGGGCLLRFAPNGQLLEKIPVPASQPTSVALSAEPPYRVVVTTAAQELENPTEHDGRVITAEVSVAGRVADSFGT